jgi:hypothetical protein
VEVFSIPLVSNVAYCFTFESHTCADDLLVVVKISC